MCFIHSPTIHILLPYVINRFALVTEIVYCDVQLEFLYIT
jgi:hypothetical protein